ncbi:protein-L-histidine N-pros-methyltransferase-like isoform X4 [Branchiostoma lanceolatum]|uniref:protein-L-histidine N-pros-methyltransferase-like isoform X4 n=1 Tax=Branchiostoma lanceolatum TaxID=7740 RepID=UPI0034523EC5
MWTSSQIRNPLARSLYMQAVRQAEIEEELRDTRYEEWYSCDVSLLSETLQPKYLPLHFDTETEEFLQGSREKSDWVFTQIFHSVVSTLLSMFVSVTSINGWLGRGSMFVFSQQHFYKLMRIPPGWQAQRLLDLGAGDGNVTRVMSDHFKEVFVTEQSPPMRERLQERGYRLLDIEEWPTPQSGLTYDLISCLNLLDRCDKPRTVLEDIRRSLSPDGHLILAVVLPFSPCVESGSKLVDPSEILPVEGKGWERQANSFVEQVLTPSGFEVETFSRLPYLCEGDLYHPYYILHDAVFVLRATELGDQQENRV